MKKSFSMVELIFAIIIIALAIGALPTIVSQMEKSTDVSINQEAVWMASSVLYNILDYRWDENSKGDGTEGRKAIQVNSGDTNLSKFSEPRFRIGHIIQNNRRSFFSIPAYEDYNASNTLGIDAGEDIGTFSGIDDIDDFDNYNTALSEVGYISRSQYKKKYKMSISVNYISDNANDPSTNSPNDGQYGEQIVTFKLDPTPPLGGGSTNIKLIEINVSTVDCNDNFQENIFSLKAFSCNIGEYLDLTNKAF